MALLLIVTAIAVALALIARRIVRPAARDSDIRPTFGIDATPEMIEQERVFLNEVMTTLENRIVASGIFRMEKLPELMAALRRGAIPFGRVNTKIAFGGDTYLTVPEKRSLGLNTRIKYSHAFIACCDPACLKTVEPKSALACMHRDSFNREHRLMRLREYRSQDFIEHVEIWTLPGDACAQVKRLKKRHAIGEVPNLPLPECDSECCGCTYEPIIDD